MYCAAERKTKNKFDFGKQIGVGGGDGGIRDMTFRQIRQSVAENNYVLKMETKDKHASYIRR